MVSKKLLIVEDDPKSLYALKAVLQERGFEVVACDSAESTAEILHHGFSAAILDVRLPGASGPDIATRLLRKHPGLRIIFVTAYNGVPDIQNAFPDARVLVKPIDMDALTRLL